MADIVPERAVAEGLVDALADLRRPSVGRCSREPARDATCCPTRCARAAPRWTCSRCTRRSPSSPPAHVLQEALTADYITFTSASTVRFFLRSAGASSNEAPDGDVANPRPAADTQAADTQAADARAGLSPHTRIVSIGPITSAALREHNLEPHVEASPHNIDGLVKALSRTPPDADAEADIC